MRGDHARYSDPEFQYGHFSKYLADPERCRWQVWSNERMPTPYQCSRKAKVDGLWCKIHSPEYMVEKERLWQEKFEAEHAASERKWARPGAIEAALREIAKGELNDPAGYAAMILDKWK